MSLTQWYPHQVKYVVVSYKDSWEDCNKCMCKVLEKKCLLVLEIFIRMDKIFKYFVKQKWQ